MENKERISLIIKRLKKDYPGARMELRSSAPVEYLVATILSAQCTDRQVNIVTKHLFKKYRSVSDYAGADLRQLEREIYSTGFYHNKAKNIINSAKKILKDFGGKVPKTMDELLTLPGVARKTANVVLGAAFGIVEGIVVDTHVIRLSRLLGFTRFDNPVKIERDLMKIIPKSMWFNISFLLQAHGRKICKAGRPNCPECSLNKLCPSTKMG